MNKKSWRIVAFIRRPRFTFSEVAFLCLVAMFAGFCGGTKIGLLGRDMLLGTSVEGPMKRPLLEIKDEVGSPKQVRPIGEVIGV